MIYFARQRRAGLPHRAVRSPGSDELPGIRRPAKVAGLGKGNIMKIRYPAILAVAFTSIALPAAADNGFSAELLLGSADQEFTASDSVDSVKLSDNSMSYGVRGVYQFNDYFGVELSYQESGEAEKSFIDEFDATIGTEFETRQINVGVKGMIPLQGGFSLVGRLGLSSWDFDADLTDSDFPGVVAELSDSGSDLYYGVGGQYRFNDNLYMGLEYTMLNVDLGLGDLFDDPTDPVRAEHDVNSIMLTVGWTF